MGLDASYDIGFIYRDYYKDLYRYVYMMTQNKEATEDIVQNVFIKVMKSIKNFRGEAHLKTWLITIARNETINYQKKEVPHRTLKEVPQTEVTDHLIKIQCEKEMTDSILRYIHTLEEPKKSLMILRLLDELSFVEISHIIEKSDTWCRVTFMRIKSNMLKELEDVL